MQSVSRRVETPLAKRNTAIRCHEHYSEELHNTSGSSRGTNTNVTQVGPLNVQAEKKWQRPLEHSSAIRSHEYYSEELHNTSGSWGGTNTNVTHVCSLNVHAEKRCHGPPEPRNEKILNGYPQWHHGHGAVNAVQRGKDKRIYDDVGRAHKTTTNYKVSQKGKMEYTDRHVQLQKVYG